MKKIRIHNDIHVSWGITTNGKQESLEAKTLQVQLVVYNKVITIPDFTINGNVVSFEFSGSQQKYCGVYTLVCRDTTNGNLSTIDKTEAFELVPHSEEEQGKDNPNVALEVVALNTDRDSSTIGRAATVSIGEVKTLDSGEPAYVRNSGTVNDAVLDFGIPSGSSGNDGLDGSGVMADPSSVTFNTDQFGNVISSKLIRMKAYKGGKYVGDAQIVKITTTNFKSDIDIEADGSSFYIRGANITSVETTDLNGNAILIPSTQAEVYVVCTLPDSDYQYAATVRVFVNIQGFYTSLVSNQKEFKQSFTELKINVNEQGEKMEQYYSEFKQTAKSLSATISQNKSDSDGSLGEVTNKIEATASSLSATIEENKKEVDGTIENLRTEFKATTDGISTTVEKYKEETDGKISEANSKITQTSEEINVKIESNKTDTDGKIENLNNTITATSDSLTSKIESYKKDTDGNIEKLSSSISQNTKNIEIANSRFNADGTLKNKSGLVTSADIAELASREYVDGKVVSEATIRTMVQDGISSAVISADQINLKGKTMKFASGQIEIDSENLKLDSSGNLKVAGDIHAKTVRLKISSSHDNILSGSLLLGGGTYTMPQLTAEDGYVNLKLYAPLLTRSSPVPILQCISTNVFLQLASEKTELPKSGKKELDYGAYDIVGFYNNGQTFWIIK